MQHAAALVMWLITAWEAGWTSAISDSVQNCGWQLYLQKQFESAVAGLIFTVSGCSSICNDNTVSIIWIYIAKFACEAPLALHALQTCTREKGELTPEPNEFISKHGKLGSSHPPTFVAAACTC